MTKEETGKILAVIDAAYPNFKPTDLIAIVTAWHSILEDFSYAEISMALKTYIRTDNSNFPPSISKLISLTSCVEEYSLPTEAEAWTMVRQAVSRSGWHSEEEFAKLPEPVQIAVVSPRNLYEWSQIDVEEFETVISSNFLRAYRGAVKRSMDVKRLPEEMRIAIESNRQKLLGENSQLVLTGGRGYGESIEYH